MVTTIQVGEDLADELHDRKNRGDSYEDVIWRLIDAADRAGELTPSGFSEAGHVLFNDEPTEPAAGPDVGPDDVAAWVDAIDVDRLEDHLGAVDFPSNKDRADCLEAVAAAYGYLRERRSATMRQFVRDVMPDYSLGYDVPELKEGDRYRGGWWRRIVKPGLAALPDIRAPGGGETHWTLEG